MAWYRVLEAAWIEFERIHGEASLSVFMTAHRRFNTLGDEKDVGAAWEDWCRKFHTYPGVYLIPKAETFGTVMVESLHHSSSYKKGNKVYLMGLSNLSAEAMMQGVDADELFQRLVTRERAGKDSEGKDRFVPSIKGLMTGRLPMEGSFTPGMGDNCPSVESLLSKPNGVFIPVQMVKMIWGENDDDYPMLDFARDDRGNHPLVLIKKIIDGVKRGEKEKGVSKSQKELMREMAQNVIDLCWAVSEEMATGVEIRSLMADIVPMRTYLRLQKEMLKIMSEEQGFASDDSEEEEEKEADAILESSDEEDSRDPREHSDRKPRAKGPSRNPREKGRSDPSGERAMEDLATPKGQSRRSPRFPRDARLARSPEGRGSNEGEEERGSGRRSRLPPPPTGVNRPSTSPPRRSPPLGSSNRSTSDQWMERALENMDRNTSALCDMAQASRLAWEKKEEEKKAMSKWIAPAVFVFRALSTEDGWQTQGVPELTEFAKHVMSQKLFHATQLIRDEARQGKWEGCLLKAGMSEMLRKGFIADDIRVAPGGFSVLFFHPSGFVEVDGVDFSEQQLRETFGDGKLPDELVKAFTKLQIFVPENTYTARDQIEAAISFLKSMCGDSTIATAGFSRGLEILKDNKVIFDAEMTKDKMFLFNYLYLLDTVFDAFCRELRRYQDETNPILEFKRNNGETWMTGLIDRTIMPWTILGTIPPLQPPTSLQGKRSLGGLVDLSKGSSGSSGSKAPPKVDGQAKRKRAVDESPDKGKAGNKKLPAGDYVSEWQIPEGKKMIDFFGLEKRKNLQGLPKVKHHVTGRPAALCLKYQLNDGWGCNLGSNCRHAHVRPSDLSQEEFEKVSSHLKKVYHES